MGAQGTHILSNTHSHTHTVHYGKFLIKNKVYQNVTN